ncbi:putative protein kinase RLK-Pelle-DLSV family [Helianthus annuus]|nr:putative protein kinase RLK-Pelle-DLSV family [Helianthus annuus]KAJ0762716.1 putative protein kinase RLK-Pelle-DLSV family [Helianthus annuus]KAJ0932973.1 putative protein kinase RLK-Pelle-DLSV family [Helianthus annuus]
MGHFFDYHGDSSPYILSNTSNLHDISTHDSELYTTARGSAISLTYYVLCLMEGNYTVKLHFAEIVLTQYNSSNILGKRVFNVYLQEDLWLKDFDIAKEAGGVGRAVIKTRSIHVKNNTLKIRLYWAGKGTTNIPYIGCYGPIISAISVDAGHRHLLGDIRVFKFSEIKAATSNFKSSNKRGEGGFGSVYEGKLKDGTIVAIKQLSSRSKQGREEFIDEISMISSMNHVNLVRLVGFCDHKRPCVVYEYMRYNSLSQALSDKGAKGRLTWPVRVQICMGVAQGLFYLHEGSNVQIIHRDIKPSNILLDENFIPKISDFGIAKQNENRKSDHTINIKGTRAYMAPEYATRGCFTPLADVYSFGLVALELVSGKPVRQGFADDPNISVFDKAHVLKDMKGDLLELVDRDLGNEYSPEEALRIINVAILCMGSCPPLRPTMRETIQLLEGRADIAGFQDEKRNVNKEKDLANFQKLRKALLMGETSTQPFVTETFVTESSVETESLITESRAGPSTQPLETESFVTEITELR